MPRSEARLFSALLRHWRTKRGLSQLDLALAAEVSSRHISFLETGRAQPSRDMVLLLGATLDVPLRDQNVLLHAAGFPEEFAEPSFVDALPPPIAAAIERMLAQQEPYPMMVLDHRYDVLEVNAAGARMMQHLVLDPAALGSPRNLMRMVFDPRLSRSFIADWERVAKTLLSRLHREALTRAGDSVLTGLIEELLALPDVPRSFRTPDLSQPSEPTLSFRIRVAGIELSFLTTLTVFNAPQNVTLEELRIESYFPLDETTAQLCQQLATPKSQ
jgi:transcriptional regulator with XRE-family HTH domain